MMGDLMRRFGLTGKVLVKVDREVDPYQHIDHVREEVFDQGQVIEALDKRVLLLEEAERKRERPLTESGVWKVVKAKLDAEAVDWAKWAVRGILAGVCGIVFALVQWLIRWWIQRALHS